MFQFRKSHFHLQEEMIIHIEQTEGLQSQKKPGLKLSFLMLGKQSKISL